MGNSYIIAIHSSNDWHMQQLICKAVIVIVIYFWLVYVHVSWFALHFGINGTSKFVISQDETKSEITNFMSVQ